MVPLVTTQKVSPTHLSCRHLKSVPVGAGRFHASLEKLPSLSDVPGSLHTSPVPSHTTPASRDLVTVAPGSSFAKSMVWLNSLLRMFSSWDDRER